jgi:hypothetical protein
MAAEVVVVVEDQDAGFGASALAVEVGRSKSADAAADDDEVVGLTGFRGGAVIVPSFAITQTVSIGVGALVIAPHPGERGGIVAGGLFGSELVGGNEGGDKGVGGQQATHTDGHTV